jgi:glutathione synthase/RimK-type ligase-like ATP-grasp enzyme
LDRYDNSRPNKILQLQIANKVGLNIPDSRLIVNKDNMLSFAKRKGKIIIKPIQDVFSIHDENVPYTQYTKVLSISGQKGQIGTKGNKGIRDKQASYKEQER